jgi:1,4-dihydroxy-2-naphthoate octaprenyltransferase
VNVKFTLFDIKYILILHSVAEKTKNSILEYLKKMSSLKTWISAMRLRTLPLAVSAILLGIAMASLLYRVNSFVALLCLLTAICLQILSNFANDYGDFIKGTDNEKRLGNMRALQSGDITIGQMRIAMMVLVLLSLVSGITLLYTATAGNINTNFLLFLLLGIASIVAALKYTVGKNAYGYSGLGDIAVFIFFGPVSVIGTFLLCSNFAFDWNSNWYIFFPSLSIGLLSTAVLNTNNIRDIENDFASGKFTIPVKIGLHKARIYHSILILLALLSFCIGLYFVYNHWIQLLVFPAMFLIVKTCLGVLKTNPSPTYNVFLKQLSLGILLLVLVFITTSFVAHIIMGVEAFNAMSRLIQ